MWGLAIFIFRPPHPPASKTPHAVPRPSSHCIIFFSFFVCMFLSSLTTKTLQWFFLVVAEKRDNSTTRGEMVGYDGGKSATCMEEEIIWVVTWFTYIVYACLVHSPTCTHTSINIVLLCLISKLLASKQTFLGSFHWDLSYYYLEEIRVSCFTWSWSTIFKVYNFVNANSCSIVGIILSY
jgi:hypothetical protein